MVRIAECHVEARADVVAKRDRARKIGAVAALLLGDRERRRHDGTARMEAAAEVRIVGFVGVAGHGIGKRGAFGRHDQRCADDGRLLRSAKAVHVARGNPPGAQP